MNLSALRAEALERDGGCRWPGCCYAGRLELAHLEHRGMGGHPSANTLENVVILCEMHHAILDGRTVQGRRLEVCGLLVAYLRRV